ncbi:hypothetical protein [Parapedobacter sp. DT-150]|uniref:hypothetical protein n=1 Tax=Parapedobacter sp. DT-150 TaxID=3396162 RepID=UPI003F1BD62B
MIILDKPKQEALIAQPYYSGFAIAHDTYNAISKAGDGRIYYILSSEQVDEGGKMFVYDPQSDETSLLADLTEICGEAGQHAVAQGKSHSRFYEYRGKLYLSTHVGYYEMVNGMERLPKNLPAGIAPYPGGHFLSYDLGSGAFEELCTAPEGEGFVAMTMDAQRGQLFGITWPTGYFVHYDVENRSVHRVDPVSERGEAGDPGHDFRTLCRSLLVNPTDGKVYFTTADGDIFAYDPGARAIRKLEVELKLDYFGSYDPTHPGSMAYNWRKIFWYSPEQVAYGIHGNSGYLFRFDPNVPSIELVQRLTSAASQRSGMYDQFSYGYLGFQLGPDGHTIYYLTGGPVYEDGQRVKGQDLIAKGGAKGVENLHLVTYHIPERRYTDHGPIFYPDGSRPSYVNAIAVGDDGFLYTLARYTYQGREIADLIKIPNPLFS